MRSKSYITRSMQLLFLANTMHATVAARKQRERRSPLATWTSYSAHRDRQSALSAHSAVLWNGHAAGARSQAVACAACQTCMQPSEGLHRFPLQLKSLTQCSPLRTCGGSHHSGSKRYVASHIHGITRCRPRAWPWGGDARMGVLCCCRVPICLSPCVRDLHQCCMICVCVCMAF
jgi:hypothetical protein